MDRLRSELVAAMWQMGELGLNRGSTGNASARCALDGRPGMLITPTGMGGDDLGPADLAWVGADGSAQGPWQPSSEWRFHLAIYSTRPDLHAVLHSHSVHATALACLRRGLPSFHYMVAVAGGDSIPCTPYHTFGSEALALAVADAVRDRHACLMANHGLVAGGTTIAHAIKVLCEVEALCEVYLRALAVGEPPLLDAAQMAEVIDKFRSYGKTARR
jgi:L-fuculose-phosphate aldolase